MAFTGVFTPTVTGKNINVAGIFIIFDGGKMA